MRPGQDLDPAPGETDAGAVEALDDSLFRRPSAREAFVVPVAVDELGRRVDLGEEAGAGALDGKRDPVD